MPLSRCSNTAVASTKLNNESSSTFVNLPNEILVHIGANLGDFSDVVAFEKAAGGPINGLFPALFNGRLQHALSKPLASLKYENPRSCGQGRLAPPAIPDALMRRLVLEKGVPTYLDGWEKSADGEIYDAWSKLSSNSFNMWRDVASHEEWASLPLMRNIRDQNERRVIRKTFALARSVRDDAVQMRDFFYLMVEMGTLLDNSPTALARINRMQNMLADIQSEVEDQTIVIHWPKDVIDALRVVRKIESDFINAIAVDLARDSFTLRSYMCHLSDNCVTLALSIGCFRMDELHAI